MQRDYDAIVVGSGLGGLSAATTLARGGAKVRLFERHTQVGGYATTFYRGRFEFETSLHALSGNGSEDRPGPLLRRLQELDVARRVDFIPSPHLWRSVASNLDVDVLPGKDQALEAMVQAFPHEREGLSWLVERMFAIGREVDEITAMGGKALSPATIMTRFPNVGHAAGVPVSALLDDAISDPRARMVFAQLWGYFGLPPSKLSLLLFGAAFYSYVHRGACIIRGKSQSLSDAFRDTIEEAGGQVSTFHGVKRILVEDGRVAGVVTDRDEEYRAPVVVSNADPVTTCTRLVDPDEIPVKFHKRLSVARPGLSILSLYLGLHRTCKDVGIQDYEVYQNDTPDMDEQYRCCFDMVPPRYMGLCAYGAINPDFSPPGTGVVVLSALSDGEMWTRLEPASYPGVKMKMGEYMLERAERMYPGLRDAVETAVVSTPLTNIRYTGNPLGAVYGFASTPSENPGMRIERKGPIEGLWFAGAWTQPGGGYQPTINSGYLAGRAILETLDDVQRPERTSVTDTTSGSLSWRERMKQRMDGYRLIRRDLKTVGRTMATRFAGPGLHVTVAPLTERSPRESLAYRAERLPVILAERLEETPSTVVLRYRAARGQLPAFHAGQYFNLFVDIDSATASRPYSVSSPPAAPSTLELTVKRRSGGFVSEFLFERARVGDAASITGPDGEFFYNPLRDTRDIVGIAAGSGITPLMSMAEEIAATRRAVKMMLIYGSRDEKEYIFRERLEHLQERNHWLTVVDVLSRPSEQWTGERGHIDGALLRRHLDPDTIPGRTFFVCGPRGLYQMALRELGAMGVPRARIRLESYGPPADVTQERNWPAHLGADTHFLVHLPGREEPIEAPAGEPLLNTLERYGHPTSPVCRSDVCDSCKLRLAEGEVYKPPAEEGYEVEHDEAYIHPCMVYPTSNLTLKE